ncbi:DUF6082 family protein [Actinoplanes sp. NPDC048796]|uniref:DUF6082 family protein n=1 Tax=Actinoplanes sp. NPDC048796 TaxID=3155640 RepID=UPI003401B6BA
MQQTHPLMGHEVFGTAEDVRRQIFGTYFLNYVHAGYSVGFFEDKYLAADVFPRFFKFDTGREYWEAMRPVWVARYITKRSRKFVAMLDASYGQAVLAGPPVIAGAPTATAVEAKKGSSRPASVLLAGGLVAGALIGGWLARRNT